MVGEISRLESDRFLGSQSSNSHDTAYFLLARLRSLRVNLIRICADILDFRKRLAYFETGFTSAITICGLHKNLILGAK